MPGGELFRPPENPDQLIWRYMDFTKFVSLLDRQALYFPNLETLARSDPFEGSLAKPTIELFNVDAHNLSSDQVQKLGFKGYEELASYLSLMKNDVAPHRRLYRKIREITYVNCWHINDYESAAMWAIYSGNSPGIALKSSYSRLKDSLSSSQESISIGKTIYIDYDNQHIALNDFTAPSIYKRRSFEYERELRAYILKIEYLSAKDERGKPIVNVDAEVPDSGLYIACDLNKLVIEIMVSPRSPDWYLSLVTSTTRRFGYEFTIHRSDLATEPLF